MQISQRMQEVVRQACKGEEAEESQEDPTADIGEAEHQHEAKNPSAAIEEAAVDLKEDW